jgi:hypothetical protein
VSDRKVDCVLAYTVSVIPAELASSAAPCDPSVITVATGRGVRGLPSVTPPAMSVAAEASHGHRDRHEGGSLVWTIPDMVQDEPR